MTFLYLKALHIIFVVTWFAGLFYIPRLFIYVTEAHSKTEAERSVLLPQLMLMTRRLWYGITWPSAVITLALGVAMLVNNPDWLARSFMHLKLTLVILLYGYHFSLQHVFNGLRAGMIRYTSTQLRIWNEVATLFLVSIVFIIVLKDAFSVVWGVAGLVALTLIILTGIRLYKQYRNEK